MSKAFSIILLERALDLQRPCSSNFAMVVVMEFTIIVFNISQINYNSFVLALGSMFSTSAVATDIVILDDQSSSWDLTGKLEVLARPVQEIKESVFMPAPVAVAA